MEYSKYQKDIFDTYNNTRRNIVVEAAPGSGKTFTIVELLKMTPPYKKVLMMAFNKSIQKELKERVPKFVDVYTFHAMGFRILAQNFDENFYVNNDKSFKLFYPLIVKKFGDKKALKLIPQLLEYSSFYRMGFCQSEKDIKEILKNRDIYYTDDEISLLMDCHKELDKYNKEKHSKFMIDFTDMIELPLKWIKENNFPKYQVVMIDEIQDCNRLQTMFMERLIDKRGRFVGVGDPKQSIYGFMGSDKNSFKLLQSKPNTSNLPLSVSYRCPKKVIAKASLYYEGVEAYEENEEGIVRNGFIDEAGNGDFIICRNNLPLFKAFIYLILKGKKVSIVGKDLQNNILKILNDYLSKGGYELRYEEILTNKENDLKERGIKRPLKNKSYIGLKDLLDTVSLLINHFGNENKAKKKLDLIFNDEGHGIKLMTGHKSKGLEADRIFWLMPQLIPSEYVKTKQDLEQEKSLAFVIITRAKKELIMVKDI